MAFTVEDGTGLSGANSYASVVEADSYVTDYIRNSSTWTSLSSANKQKYLVEASQSVDLIFHSRWLGYRLDQNQGLAWPRVAGYDKDGYSVASDEVPANVKRATAEMAWRHLNDTGPSTTTGDSTGIIPDISSPGTIAETDVAAGSVRSKTRYLSGKSQIKMFRKVEMILHQLIKPRGAIVRS